MSRIGLKPITIPSGVDIKINDNNLVEVKGPKGQLTQQLSPEMEIKIEDGVLTVARPSENKKHRSLHGLTRTLIENSNRSYWRIFKTSRNGRSWIQS